MKNTYPVIKDASNFVFNLFKERLHGDCIYHNYKHTADTAKACKELAGAYNLTSRDFEILMLAAWFHDSGYTEVYKGHEERSVAIMKNHLQGQYKVEDLAEIEKLILSTNPETTPDGTLQEILHDADYISIGKKNFNERAELLRIEWERALKVIYKDLEWAEEQLTFLLNTTFKTEEAIATLGKQREINIRTQYARIAQLKSEELKIQTKLGKNNESKPAKLGRGIETLYRSVYSYHINLSSIADNKAQIMININTIIISLVITLFGSGYTFSGQDEVESLRFVFPMASLLITSLLAVVFAILSARPTVTSKEKYELSNKTSSILFFGNFSQLQLTEFVDKIRYLKDQNEELYESMTVDIYHLGNVLVKKYRLLTWSYTIFMTGLIICAVGFMIIMAFSFDS